MRFNIIGQRLVQKPKPVYNTTSFSAHSKANTRKKEEILTMNEKRIPKVNVYGFFSGREFPFIYFFTQGEFQQVLNRLRNHQPPERNSINIIVTTIGGISPRDAVAFADILRILYSQENIGVKIFTNIHGLELLLQRISEDLQRKEQEMNKSNQNGNGVINITENCGVLGIGLNANSFPKGFMTLASFRPITTNESKRLSGIPHGTLAVFITQKAHSDTKGNFCHLAIQKGIRYLICRDTENAIEKLDQQVVFPEIDAEAKGLLEEAMQGIEQEHNSEFRIAQDAGVSFEEQWRLRMEYKNGREQSFALPYAPREPLTTSDVPAPAKEVETIAPSSVMEQNHNTRNQRPNQKTNKEWVFEAIAALGIGNTTPSLIKTWLQKNAVDVNIPKNTVETYLNLARKKERISLLKNVSQLEKQDVELAPPNITSSNANDEILTKPTQNEPAQTAIAYSLRDGGSENARMTLTEPSINKWQEGFDSEVLDIARSIQAAMNNKFGVQIAAMSSEIARLQSELAKRDELLSHFAALANQIPTIHEFKS